MVENIIKSALNEALKELDYGKNLFADPTVKRLPTQRGAVKFPPPNQYQEFLHGDSESPNTEEEMAVLTDIVNFTRENYNNIEDFKNNAQELLALKSKFPKMLDPKQGKNTGKLVYRGATIPISVLQKLASKINPAIGENSPYTIENPGVKITPSSGRGIHSFSASLMEALNFMDTTSGKIDRPKGKIPVIFAIDSSEPNLLFNPDFLDTVSIFNEQEVMLIGDSFIPKEIYIYRSELEWRLSDEEKEELDKILPSKRNVDEGEIEEGKQVGTIYHYTSLKSADNILKTGFIQGSDKSISGYSSRIKQNDNQYSLSFTRNKNFHSVYRLIGSDVECRFVIDGDALSNKYKVQPVAAWGFGKSKSKDFEAEEAIVSPSQIKVPIKPYVKSIDLLIEPTDNWTVDGFDPYKFIKVLKQIKSKGIEVNVVDKNGNPAPKDLRLSFSQWLKKPIHKAVNRLIENKQPIPEIEEGKQVGTLYHYTSLKVANKILKDGFIMGSDRAILGYSDNVIGKNYYSLSFTRDKNFHEVHRVIGARLQCRFVLDGDALSNKYKIQPVAARGFEKSNPKEFEAEEVIMSPSQIKVPVKPYVKGIDLLVEPTRYWNVDGFDPYKFTKALKQIKDQGIEINIMDRNGNFIPKIISKFY